MEGVLFVIDLADLEIPIYSVDDFRANSDPLDRTTRPETFVLGGVRSPRTYASLVTCSTRPPSRPFVFGCSSKASVALTVDSKA